MEYMPEVIQVIPTDDFKVYVYFDDGTIKLYDASEDVKFGGFTKLQDLKLFKNCCTVLNGTLDWDLEGNYDETKCLDIDPFNIYENSPGVEDQNFYLASNHNIYFCHIIILLRNIM